MLREPEKLQLLHISLVREYLALDLLPAKIAYSQEQIAFRNQDAAHGDSLSPGGSARLNRPGEASQQSPLEGRPNRRVDKMLCCPAETERAIDDFVIFCFLAGNDFLPHTFSTDIGEKGLDRIPCTGRIRNEQNAGGWPMACRELPMLNNFGGDTCKAFRAKFYMQKLNIVLGTERGERELQHLCQSYLEGLQWVAYYYFRGPDASGWRWFYSYHYAPFLRDVLDCNVFSPSMVSRGAGAGKRCEDLSYLLDRTIALPSGEPYSPFMQLLSILPPQ
ncbi:uncharacterized protein EMH_0094180 [Eimeria mitis]|nr:uncharacterized protein EMH_0094180 [Eimeria mitis]CDJ34959.1 hypothetical protein EMH_0094180 [Eimeria mitis]